MCTVNQKCIPLQEQQTFCSLPNSCCRYVEVKTGRSKWEKRTAVFVQGDGEPAKIVIYTKPLIGQIYPMNNLPKLEVKQEKNGFVVKLVTQKGLKLTLKFGGKEAAVWAAAVVCGNFSALRHSTHGQAPDGASMNMEADLRDKPNPNAYTGTREGYVAPPKDASGGDKKKGSGKSERNKKESLRKLKKTVSKSAAKKSSSESRSQEKNTLATTQTLEMTTAKADDGPANSGESEPEHDGLKTKKTQTLTADGTEAATKSGEAKQKQETPISMTPGTTQSVTPGSEDREKKKTTITLTNSDENELPAKK